jgi:hypothetical protein
MRVMTVMKIQSKTAGMVYKEKDAVTGAAKVPPNAYRGFFLPLSYRYSAFPWTVLRAVSSDMPTNLRRRSSKAVRQAFTAS